MVLKLYMKFPKESLRTYSYFPNPIHSKGIST